MRPPRLTRRVLLRGSAAGLAAAAVSGCAAERKTAPEPPDPQVVLLRELVADKERTVALYGRAAEADADLAPFLRRHEEHLAELRRRLPPPPTPTPGATPSRTPAPARPSPGKVTPAALRDLERASAAARADQVRSAAPALAQLLASIGACEAAHAAALSRSP
ncbi:hypothetical protein [Spongiactinospora sp. 9N601]|uniref:hypothetical protein n=1 Tax=Spongiactinospora sp. 9N601 TaxID=3375149 RepID=UPI0037AE6607